MEHPSQEQFDANVALHAIGDTSQWARETMFQGNISLLHPYIKSLDSLMKNLQKGSDDIQALMDQFKGDLAPVYQQRAAPERMQVAWTYYYTGLEDLKINLTRLWKRLDEDKAGGMQRQYISKWIFGIANELALRDSVCLPYPR